jgi:DNA-binding LytR/AlgR family response regulator
LNPLTVLIVDDEPIARKVLREELAGIPGLNVVAEADNGATALLEIDAHKPDVVFLDIQMPLMDGFQLLSRLQGGNLPVVILVTAFDQHALQAFEAGAIDYLLKPVSPARLQQAVARASRLRRQPLAVAEHIIHLQKTVPIKTPQESPPQKIVGRIGQEYFLLSPDEVLAFQASGDSVCILASHQRYTATQNLKTIEDRLAGGSFRRIHRNALVNVNQIRKMSMLSSQRWLITMSNGQEFVVSKRQAGRVRDVLHW